jgi:hypothetical protein
MGMPFNEYQSKNPLNAMLVPAKAMPQIFMLGLLDSFNPRGQPISKKCHLCGWRGDIKMSEDITQN